MKHGILKQTGDTETFVFEARNGLSMITTGLMSPFKPGEGVVGYPKLVSVVMGAAIGNAIAVHSYSGKIGLAALGRGVSFG